MIPKCDHCPIPGRCLAFAPTCDAIRDDPGKRAAFVTLHREHAGDLPEMPSDEADRLIALTRDAMAAHPHGGCCG